MNAPHAPDGIFEGAYLFDGCDYRIAEGVEDYVDVSGKLGLVRKREGFYRAEFLTRHHSPGFSLPVWDESRERVLCGNKEEAKRLVEQFVAESATENG